MERNKGMARLVFLKRSFIYMRRCSYDAQHFLREREPKIQLKYDSRDAHSKDIQRLLITYH